jgi:hypothetical protein
MSLTSADATTQLQRDRTCLDGRTFFPCGRGSAVQPTSRLPKSDSALDPTWIFDTWKPISASHNCCFRFHLQLYSQATCLRACRLPTMASATPLRRWLDIVPLPYVAEMSRYQIPSLCPRTRSMKHYALAKKSTTIAAALILPRPMLLGLDEALLQRTGHAQAVRVIKEMLLS